MRYAAIAFLSGMAFAAFLYPVDFLLGSSRYWTSIPDDGAISWIAYLAFAQDDWRLPLLNTMLLHPPTGTNIFFADPIPLLALLGKLAFKATGYLPNYLGPWCLVSYGLQSMVGYLLLREVRLTELSALAASVLFLLVPAFIFRIEHLTLIGHWTLSLALLLYVRIVGQGRVRDACLGMALTALLVFVHLYLLAMVMAIYLAALGDGTLRRTLTPRVAITFGALLFAAVLGLGLGLGLLDPNRHLASTGGFGHYSMNALSPLFPQRSSWPGMASFILDATGGQYEGYNYLGLGLLLFSSLAFITAGHAVLQGARRYVFLTVMTLLMTLFALSSKIYLGNTLVATVAYDRIWPMDTITGIFRASGRFFWPITYFAILLTASALFFRFGQRRFMTIVSVAAAIQVVDIHPLLNSVSAKVSSATTASGIDRRAWGAVLQRHDELTVFPQFGCAKPENRKYILAIGKLAAVQGIPANSKLDNRAMQDCAAEAVVFVRNFRALSTRKNPLVVSLKTEMNAALVEKARVRAELNCRDAGFAYVCSALDGPDLAMLGGELQAPPTVKQGQVVGVGLEQDGAAFLSAGWSAGASNYVWGVGPLSSISFRTTEPICGPTMLHLRVLPFATSTFLVSPATITINDENLHVVHLSAPGETTVSIPFAQGGCTSFFDVTLRFLELRSPQELGVNRDPRLLNWSLFSFSIGTL